MKPSTAWMKSHTFSNSFAAFAAAFLLGVPGLTAGERLVADIRADFPTTGEMYHQPEWKNGWLFYAARQGVYSPQLNATWYQEETKWPQGLLSVYGTGFSAHVPGDHNDAIQVLPGDHEIWMVARWVSNTSGKLHVRGWFRRIRSTPEVVDHTSGIEFMIRHNEGESLFTGKSEAVNDTGEKEFDVLIPDAKVGDPVDIIVVGVARNWGNETQIAAKIFLEE